MNANDFLKNILTDIKVDLTQHFDRNFERKGFFTKKWPTNKLINKRGTTMARTNALRRSIKAKVENNRVSWTSSLPYADIQNNGGEIQVTAKMKRFFWAMHIKAKGGSKGKNEKAKRLSIEAEQWKGLALQPVGKIMKIPQRQFIGDHPVARGVIKRAVSNNFKDLNAYIKSKLQQ